jgi:hypothetical protein
LALTDAHIDTHNYSGKFLTWATNGFAGYVKVISGEFSINADRALLKSLYQKYQTSENFYM